MELREYQQVLPASGISESYAFPPVEDLTPILAFSFDPSRRVFTRIKGCLLWERRGGGLLLLKMQRLALGLLEVHRLYRGRYSLYIRIADTALYNHQRGGRQPKDGNHYGKATYVELSS
jgi:hypothetical protein